MVGETETAGLVNGRVVVELGRVLQPDQLAAMEGELARRFGCPVVALNADVRLARLDSTDLFAAIKAQQESIASLVGTVGELTAQVTHLREATGLLASSVAHLVAEDMGDPVGDDTLPGGQDARETDMDGLPVG